MGNTVDLDRYYYHVMVRDEHNDVEEWIVDAATDEEMENILIQNEGELVEILSKHIVTKVIL